MNDVAARPWYRSPWPWMLAVPPLSAVVFWAVILVTMAGPPEMVATDATRAGLVYTAAEPDPGAVVRSGRLQFQADSGRVAVVLRDSGGAPPEVALEMADAGGQALTLTRDGTGVYRGRLRQALDGDRRVTVAPTGGDWRLSGVIPRSGGEIELR